MKYCIDCNEEFNRGNRAERCEKCQKKQRKNDVKKYNKHYGTARRTKEIYQWSKWVETLGNNTIMALVAAYKQRLKQNNFNTEEFNQHKTMLKILTKLYNKKQITTIKDTKILSVQPEAVAPTTIDVKWERAKLGWVNYYDDGVVTLSPILFFARQFGRNVLLNRPLRVVYWLWRKGYVM